MGMRNWMTEQQEHLDGDNGDGTVEVDRIELAIAT